MIGRRILLKKVRFKKYDKCNLLDQKKKVYFLSSNYIKYIDGKFKIFNVIIDPFKHVHKDYMINFCFEYCDFLLLNISFKEKLYLFKKFTNYNRKYEYNTYTASKKLYNLIIFLLNNNIKDKEVYDSVVNYCHNLYSLILSNIEYEIDGNHLLNNYFSLALYESTFDSDQNKYFVKYHKTFAYQCSSSFHYERSLCYSQQIAYEYLILFQIKEYNETLPIFQNLLKSIYLFEKFNTYFGDNIKEQSPSFISIYNIYEKLFANSLYFSLQTNISICNYHFLKSENSFRVALDGGVASPSYQPGHAHDSTGGIILSDKNQRIFIPGGISTYEFNNRRSYERSCRNYSKPINLGYSQDVWSSFRVGKRYNPKLLYKSENTIKLKIFTSKSSYVRELICSKNCIEDKFYFQYLDSEVIINYIISPDISVYKNKCGLLSLKSKNTTYLINYPSDVPCEIKNIKVAISYLILSDTVCLRFKCKSNKFKIKINKN